MRINIFQQVSKSQFYDDFLIFNTLWTLNAKVSSFYIINIDSLRFIELSILFQLPEEQW